MKNLISHLKHHLTPPLAAALLSLALPPRAVQAQAELAPWGNLTGIRRQGQLLEVPTSLQVVRADWAHVVATAHERQRPTYTRQGPRQLVTTRLDSLVFRETVEDTGAGQATVTVQLSSETNRPLLGAFFALALPPAAYAKATVQFLDGQGKVLASRPLDGPAGDAPAAHQIRITAPTRQLLLGFAEPTQVQLRPDAATHNPTLYVPLLTGSVRKGQTAQRAITLTSSGEIDRAPIQLTLNPAQPGRPWAGFGGNFRLQNPAGDPPVINYCLQHMRVAYGRVEMPWQLWQPDLAQDPTAAARQGQLAPHVRESLEMAQRLGKLGMPVVVTAWSAPQWAVVGDQGNGTGPGADGRWGAPLNPVNLQASYKSIADYLVYLKEQYGVEATLFSFNESDLGINIRQTGQEHADLIKNLGAYFVARGLKTKLLLGDNSDATSYSFIGPALQDAAARPYIGAVSFHSWRGWDAPTLQKWAAAAEAIKLPLLVGEGSIDAQAWGYPAIFEEPTYATQEISLYLRLLAICQPLSILQWQLTSDYSPLAGGGLFGNTAPLHPTQRFWNLKQLAATPPDVAYLPLTANRPAIACAALGNPAKGVYAVHMVNNGATRQVTLSGLPARVKTLRAYVTDPTRTNLKTTPLPVTGGQARFTLDAGSYLTLVSE
ncbi:hypothetical protein GKZ68_06995 [Hymenobacter sp. BRD128]|uniref:hypothetical protein n=1 Tax=Hymenobacter sp. BRD128 TaxID=2675878 RepID=UPI001566D411|nr:hypothetical protein [Hymenobacter sp. BRD128]QKG56403.1 hypothetical protein GKZ68_06995 [Hymenobacter sp. BRD128]